MKTLLAGMLLIGFIALAVFGFIEITSSTMPNGETHRGCLASAVQNTDCPNKLSNFGSAFFHIAAFKFFSTLTLETIVSLSILLALITAAFLLIYFLELHLALAPMPTISHRQSAQSTFNPSSNLQLLLRWLALKELSPTR